MKKILFTLLIAVTTMAFITSCEKEVDGNAVQNGIKQLDLDITPEGSNLKGMGPVIEWGSTISRTEGDTRIARWITANSDWLSNGRLDNDNYSDIKDVDSVAGVGISLRDSAGLIVFPVNADNKPIDSLFFRLNSSGGVEVIDTIAIADILDFDNEEGVYPAIITFGLDLLNNIAAQSGYVGFSFSNAFDAHQSSDDYDIIVRAYNSSGTEITDTTGTVAGKSCGTWIAGHYIFCNPSPCWIAAHWEPCGAIAQALWNVAHQ